VVGDPVLKSKPSEQTTAVINLVDEIMEGWDDHEIEESDLVPGEAKVILCKKIVSDAVIAEWPRFT
jgi:hypothetical protein